MLSKVYLAGPIAGCSDNEAMTWREEVKARIGAENCIDPMRRDYRGRESHAVNEIVELDKKDIGEANLVLANCWQVTWGTAMEIMYAYEREKPVIAIVGPGVKISPWILYHTTVASSLEEAYLLLGVFA